MLGYEAKPVLMGETGTGKATVASAAAALDQVRRWIADSCAVGFDGWLNWGSPPLAGRCRRGRLGPPG